MKNLKMEAEEDDQENQANRVEQGNATKRRMTLQEYEDQFNKRMTEEI